MENSSEGLAYEVLQQPNPRQSSVSILRIEHANQFSRTRAEFHLGVNLIKQHFVFTEKKPVKHPYCSEGKRMS